MAFTSGLWLSNPPPPAPFYLHNLVIHGRFPVSQVCWALFHLLTFPHPDHYLEYAYYSCPCHYSVHAYFIVVQLLSHVQLLAIPWTMACQAPPLSPRVCSDSCPLSWWCYLTISSSATPFSFSFWSFPASGSFPMELAFTWGGQSIRASASASVLPVNIQGWFPLRLTSLIFLQSKGLSRVFFSVTTWKHQFFSAQPSLWSSSHIPIWLLGKP